MVSSFRRWSWESNLSPIFISPSSFNYFVYVLSITPTISPFKPTTLSPTLSPTLEPVSLPTLVPTKSDGLTKISDNSTAMLSLSLSETDSVFYNGVLYITGGITQNTLLYKSTVGYCFFLFEHQFFYT